MRKQALSVETREYTQIANVGRRQNLEIGIDTILQYAFAVNHHLGLVEKYNVYNQVYINVLFGRINSLYEVYEPEKQHFELLDTAAINLDRLYGEKLAALSAVADIDQTKTELADYLDKVTMIFQTAADKTEDKEIRNFCAAKAKQYSDKADRLRGRTFSMNYTAKLQALYASAAAACGFDFIRELLQARADEYKQKHAEEVANAHESIPLFWSSASSKKQELQPLLAGSESQDGLHRRAFTTSKVPS